MCRRKRSRPSSKRRLTKNVKRLSSGRSVCASARGGGDEHGLRTNGAALAAGPSVCLASAPVRAEEKLAVAVIDFPGNRNPQRTRSSRTALIRATAGVVGVELGCAIVAAPPSWDRPFRPVALRPRLSTSLPLSLRPKCQSVADCSQVPILCRASHVGLLRYGAPRYVSPERRRYFPVPEAAGTHQAPRVEAVAAQIAIPHGQPRAGRVDEAASSGIDADVIDAALADAEKHQVPGLQLLQRHRVRRALLLGGGARNGQTCALVHGPRPPAAVETGGVGAAELVRGADQRRRRPRDRGPLLRARGRGRGEAAARGGEQREGDGERGAHPARARKSRDYRARAGALGCAGARVREAPRCASVWIPS